MQVSELKISALCMVFIAALFLWLLSMQFPGHGDVLLPISASLIGAIGAAILVLCTPAPERQIPMSLAVAMLAGAAPQGTADHVRSGVDWRENVIVLALMACFLVLILSYMFGTTHAQTLLTLAAGIIGFIGGIMRDLVTPRPDPSVPAEVVLEWQRQQRG